MKYEIVINGAKRCVEFDPSRSVVVIDGIEIAADAKKISSGVFSILLGGRSFEVTAEKNGDSLLLRTAGREFHVEIFDPRSWRRGRYGNLELEGRQKLTAPMPGKIIRVLVAPGENVKLGQGLLVIEAMKMQNEVRSPKAGIVEQLAKQGQTVNAGEILAVVV